MAEGLAAGDAVGEVADVGKVDAFGECGKFDTPAATAPPTFPPPAPAVRFTCDMFGIFKAPGATGGTDDAGTLVPD